jgi:hypothetical protein
VPTVSRSTLGLLFTFLAFARGYSPACTCSEMSVSDAKQRADIVFAGRVEEVTPVDAKGLREPRAIIRFSVARVWKAR